MEGTRCKKGFKMLKGSTKCLLLLFLRATLHAVVVGGEGVGDAAELYEQGMKACLEGQAAVCENLLQRSLVSCEGLGRNGEAG